MISSITSSIGGSGGCGLNSFGDGNGKSIGLGGSGKLSTGGLSSILTISSPPEPPSVIISIISSTAIGPDGIGAGPANISVFCGGAPNVCGPEPPGPSGPPPPSFTPPDNVVINGVIVD